MTLKLLSQSEASSRARKSTEAEKHRLMEVQSLITEKYKELSQAETDFADALLKQQGVWADHLKTFEEKRDRLKKEVEELEERKRQALIPLTEREKMLDTRASALDAREANLTEKKADLDTKDSLLTVKLDEVAERELQADAMAKSLTQREAGIQLQAGQITRDQALLATTSTQLTKHVNEAEHAIAIKWAEVHAKEQNIIERERKVNEAEAGFAARERVLQDKYATLERTTKRLHNGPSTPRPK